MWVAKHSPHIPMNIQPTDSIGWQHMNETCFSGLVLNVVVDQHYCFKRHPSYLKVCDLHNTCCEGPVPNEPFELGLSNETSQISTQIELFQFISFLMNIFLKYFFVIKNWIYFESIWILVVFLVNSDSFHPDETEK